MLSKTLSKRKVCVVITNRANYARIKHFLYKAKKSNKIDLQIILSGSALIHRFGDIESLIEREGLTINAKAYFLLEGGNAVTQAKSTGLAIIELTNIFQKLNPDIVLTVGDRYETMATAIASTYSNIFLAHIQGGEVSGNLDENVRHSITKLSHLHFATTKKSMNRILRLGEEKSRVFHTGCPSIDLINSSTTKMNKEFFNNIGSLGEKVDYKKPYILAINHPLSTDIKSNKSNTKIFLDALSKRKEQIIYLWPNPDAGTDYVSKKIREFREYKKQSSFTFLVNVSPEDYITLLSNAICLVGNSSSFIREGSKLGKSALIIGERQNNREVGKNVMRASYNIKEINKKIDIQIKKKYLPENIYGDGKASNKILKIIEKVEINILKKITY